MSCLRKAIFGWRKDRKCYFMGSICTWEANLSAIERKISLFSQNHTATNPFGDGC